MPDPDENLIEESDRLLAKVADLREMERSKREAPISSEAFHRLAREITKKSREIMFAARAEEEIGDETDPDGHSMDQVAEEESGR